jgi:hypothetical protein
MVLFTVRMLVSAILCFTARPPFVCTPDRFMARPYGGQAAVGKSRTNARHRFV